MDGIQEKFADLKSAKKRAMAIVESGCSLKDDSLCIIQDMRGDKFGKPFYVEDGCPMVRPFERVLWSL